jgi:hypothetical protein
MGIDDRGGPSIQTARNGVRNWAAIQIHVLPPGFPKSLADGLPELLSGHGPVVGEHRCKRYAANRFRVR